MSIFNTEIYQLLLPSCFCTMWPAVPPPALLPESGLAPREHVLFVGRGEVKTVAAGPEVEVAQPAYREPPREQPRLPPFSRPPTPSLSRPVVSPPVVMGEITNPLKAEET